MPRQRTIIGQLDTAPAADRPGMGNVRSLAAVHHSTTSSLHVRALTFEARHDLQQALANGIDAAGGWILDRATLSADSAGWPIELQSRVLFRRRLRAPDVLLKWAAGPEAGQERLPEGV